MAKETINQLIDRVVGSSGLLRIPAWWMRRILQAIVADYTRGIAGVKSAVAAVRKTMATKEEVEVVNASLSRANSDISTLRNAQSTLYNNISRVEGKVNTAQATADKIFGFLPSVKFTTTDSTDVYVSIDGRRTKLEAGTNEFHYAESFSFSGCSSNISEIDLSNAWRMNFDSQQLFRSCKATKISFPIPVDSRQLTTAYFMFYLCENLSELNLTGFDSSNITNMEAMFAWSGMTQLDLSMLDTSKVTTMYGMFRGCSLTSLDLSTFDTSNVTTMADMFHRCENLTSLNLSGWNTGKVTSLKEFVRECRKLTSMDVSGFDTSNVKILDQAFAQTGLTSLDVSGFNTSKVTSMKSVFGWTPIETLDLSGWDTGNVTTMWCMFIGCNWLKSIDFSGWDTTKVTDFDCFISASGDHTPELESLDMRSFNTPSVVNFNYMFGARTTLKEIKFGILDFASATDVGGMFHACNALTTFTGEVRNLKLSLDLGFSPLTVESAMVFINGLAEVETAQTLRLKSTTYEQLTPEQIAVATARGWTITSV